MRCYGLIYNPKSGTGRRSGLLRDAAEKLKAQGHDVREFAIEKDPGETAESAFQQGCEVLVACGGDGTVNAVAKVARERNAILGVLPLGTLNHFARDLGISSPAHAERTLLAGHTRFIDAAMVNGNLFVNNSGIGIYPMMVLHRERVQKAGVPKWPAFLVASLKILFKMPFRRLLIEADGEVLARSTPFLFVGNNVYTLEGMSLGQRTCLDAGLLGICTSSHVGVPGLLRIAFRALLGTVRKDRDFTALSARKLIVRRKKKGSIHVSLDGEVRLLKMPLEYSILPRAICVIAPTESQR